MGAIISDEEMADDASVELLAIRRKMRSLNSKVREVLNEMIHSPKYSALLQEPIVTMRGDRYVIPVKSEHRGEVAGVVHDSSASGATLFIEPMAAVEINNRLRTLLSEEKDEIMLVTSSGIVTRIKAGDISCQGRPATGVRAQNLMENDTVVSVNKIVNTDKDDDDAEPESSCSVEDMQSAGEQTSLIEE